MRLIGAVTSPYVRKVRVVLAEKKLDYKFIPENVWADDTQIGAANPLGKVPCLVMDGQDAVFDSRVIVEYLDTLSPVGKLIPPPGRQRRGHVSPRVPRLVGRRHRDRHALNRRHPGPEAAGVFRRGRFTKALLAPQRRGGQYPAIA